MDNYVTGAASKSLREAKRLTQEELAERIHVSAKAVSKWETGQEVIAGIVLCAMGLAMLLIILRVPAPQNQKISTYYTFFICPAFP